MLLGSVQICRERLSGLEVDDLCQNLQENNVRLLALRQCSTKDVEFSRLVQKVGISKALLHLNFNLGLVNSLKRAQELAQALHRNRSLHTLFLHGNPLGDEGIKVVCEALAVHPNVITLDLGDCRITDASMSSITDLLPTRGAKRGLQALTLSANPGITTQGWAKFFIAMAAGCSLRTLHVDYNRIGDYGAGCLAVTLATVKGLEIIDLEGSGLTEHGGLILLHVIQKHQTGLREMNVKENKLSTRTLRYFDTILPQHKLSGQDDTSSFTSSQDSGSGTEEESIDVSPRETHLSIRATKKKAVKQATKQAKQQLPKSSHIKYNEANKLTSGKMKDHSTGPENLSYATHRKESQDDSSEDLLDNSASDSETGTETGEEPQQVFRIARRTRNLQL